jgi:hypothetical protein
VGQASAWSHQPIIRKILAHTLQCGNATRQRTSIAVVRFNHRALQLQFGCWSVLPSAFPRQSVQTRTLKLTNFLVDCDKACPTLHHLRWERRFAGKLKFSRGVWAGWDSTNCRN